MNALAHRKLILENFNSGQLVKAIDLIKSGKHEYDAKTVSNFIVSMCHGCQKNAEQVKPEVLADGFKCLVSFVKDFNENQLNNYVRSLYYCLIFCMEREKEYLILELEHVILPKFLPEHLGAKERSMYETMAWHLLNKMQKNIEAGSNSCNYTKLCNLLLAIYCKMRDAKCLLTNCSFICIKILSKLSESKEHSVLAVYRFVLSQLEKLNRPEYVELINCFTKIYLYLLKTKLKKANTCLTETLRITNILFGSKEYDCLRNLLKLPERLTQGEIENDFFESFEQYKQVYGFTNELQATCRCFVAACSALAQNHLDLNWINVPEENQLKFYKFLCSINEMWLKVILSDCCNNECQAKREFGEGLKTLNLILLLSKLYIMNNDVTENFRKYFLRYHSCYVYYLESLKKRNCNKWKIYWQTGAGHLLAIINKKSGDQKLEYLKQYVKSVTTLEEPNNRVLNKNCLLLALSSIGLIYSNQEQFEKALAYHSLNIAIHSDQSAEIDSELMKWIGIKSKFRISGIGDPALQELTMPLVLRMHQKEIESVHPHFRLDEELQIKLLLTELDCYKTRWASKVPMMVAFRDVCELVKPARAAEIFVEIFGESGKAVHPEVTRLLSDIIRQLQPKEDPSQCVHLAYLHFLKNKYDSKELANSFNERICTQLNASKVVPQPGFGLDIGEQQGDLASYEFLNLERYEKRTADLTNALNLINGISHSLMSLDEKLLNILLGLLINIGLHYTLYGHVTKPTSIWTVALKVIDLLSDNNSEKLKYQLQIIGYMMERSAASLEDLNELARRGDDVLRTFKECSEEAVNYNICKALAFLKYDFDAAYATLGQVLLHEGNFNGNHLMKTRIAFAHHKFLMFPCKFNVTGHREYDVVKIHSAYYSAACQVPYENTVEEFWRLIVYFEICEELTKMYCQLDMPREVKSYGKETAILAQKMMLPLRSMSLLYYLCQADMRCRDLDGLRLKTKGFAEIMGLSNTRKSKKSKTRIEAPPSEFEKIINDLQCEFDEITLDCPTTHFVQRSASSPSFEVENFKPPFFCEHPDQCGCSYCTSVEYQAFTLKHCYLDALYNTANELHDVAKDYFMGCVKLFRYFKTKYESKETGGMPPTFGNVFSSTHYQVLLGLSDCLALTKNFSEARKVNQKLLNYLTPVKAEHVFLYEAALSQAVMIGMKTRAQPKPVTKQFLEVVMPCVDCVKTPENKPVARTKPAPNRSPSPVPTPKKTWKGVKLKFTEEIEITESKSPNPEDVPKTADVTPLPSRRRVRVKPTLLVNNMSNDHAPPKPSRAKSNLNVDIAPPPRRVSPRSKSPCQLQSGDANQAPSLNSQATPTPVRTRSRAKSSSSPSVKPTPSGDTQPTTQAAPAPSGTKARAKSPLSPNVKPMPVTEPTTAPSRTRARAKSASRQEVTNNVNVDKTHALATRSRKKAILSDLLEPNQNSNNNGGLSDDIIEDSSPFAHTPHTLNVDAKLESVLKSNRQKNTTREDTENNFLTPQAIDFKVKTRLLTEKLKKSSRKAPISVAEAESKQDEVTSIPVPLPTSLKKSVRTNLLNKLSNESTAQTEVRRTRRKAN